MEILNRKSTEFYICGSLMTQNGLQKVVVEWDLRMHACSVYRLESLGFHNTHAYWWVRERGTERHKKK